MGSATGDVQGLVGRRAVYTAPEEVGRAAIRYFARAVGDPCRLYVGRGVRPEARVRGCDSPAHLRVRDQPVHAR